MNFQNLRISTRLALGFGVMALLIAALALIALVKTSTVESASALVLRDRYPKIARLSDVKADVSLISRAMRNILLTNDPADVREQIEGIKGARARIDASLNELDKTIVAAQGRAGMEAVKGSRERFMGVQDKLLAAAAAGRDKEARSLLVETRPLERDYREQLDALVKFQQQLMQSSADDASHAIEQLRLAIYVAVALALVIGALLAASIVRSITRPLHRALDVSRAVATGDLSVAIEAAGRDEMGQLLAALGHMQKSLANVVSGVRQNADLVATASTQISQGNNDLSSRTEEQASALQQTAASMKQLAATVRQNADNAKQGNQLAQEASTVAARGGAVVGQVVETMKGINDSSRRIADILSVIDGIAFQTNILALNAAVEAARAGEQGRGFAVVAGEVRTLAQRSADAAKEIKALITASVERVEEGSALVDQAGTTMSEVVDAIRRVTDLMGEISAASNEQSVGVGQIGEAVQQMDQATQQNAALVEESAAAADSLKSQAQQLVGSVSVFKLQHGDEATVLTAAPAAPAANLPTVRRAEFRRPAPSPTPPAPARTGTDDDDWQTF